MSLVSALRMAMRPYHYNVYYFSQSCEKLRDAIKHGAPELLIIHFKWYGIIAQSTALFTHTHAHYNYNTLYTPAVAVSGTS